VRRVAALFWLLSWFELYLEIFRFHHVRVPGGTVLMGPPVGSHPGGWLQADLASSIAAPLLFLALSILLSRIAPRPVRRSDGFPALALIAFGLTLFVLGTINQLLRKPPLDVDLALRHGNGGFLVLGGVCALCGGVLLGRRLWARRCPAAVPSRS
jgi:hypothetical protein